MGSDIVNEKSRKIFLEGISPKNGAVLATAIAELLANGLNTAQINMLGNFVSAVGQSMNYMAAQADANTPKQTNNGG